MPAAWVGAAATVAGTAASMANSGSAGNVSSSSTPFNKAYTEAGNSAALNWLNSEYMPYSIPNLSDATNQGIAGMQHSAGANSALLGQAGSMAGQFGNGSYIGRNPAYGYLSPMAAGGATNPYLDATYDQAAGKVRAGLDSQFEGAGRYGSGGHQNAVGNALGSLATNLYGGEYDQNQNRALQSGAVLGQIGQNERQQQLAGIGILPGVVQGQIANNNGLLNAGGIQDQHNMQDYWRPFTALQNYQNIVTASNGGTQNQTPYYINNAGNYAALGQGVGALGQKAYDWWNSSSTPTGSSHGGYGPSGMWNGGTGMSPNGMGIGGV